MLIKLHYNHNGTISEERVKSSKIENQPIRSKVDESGHSNINTLFKNIIVYARRNVEKKQNVLELFGEQGGAERVRIRSVGINFFKINFFIE